MDQELQKQLAQMLAQLATAATASATWASGEIPLLVREKIAYGRASESMSLALLLVGVAVSVKIGRASYRKAVDAPESSGPEILGTFGTIGSIIATAILSVVAAFQTQAVMLVWFAPRLYIVEWLRGMVGR